MITLSIVCMIWGIYSYLKIKKTCDQKNIDFNPFETNSTLYFLGFVIGLAMLFVLALYVCIQYLP